MGADLGLDEAGGGGEEHVGGDGGDDDGFDFGGGDAAVAKAVAGGFGGEIAGGGAGIDDVALADAGAVGDPLIVGVDHLFKIGAHGAWGFDLSAACSGFIYALQVGAKLVESGAHKKVMVIGADVMSSILDYTDRTTCILFGDGAGAVLIEPCEDSEVGLIDFVNEIDGSGASALYMPAGGSLHPTSHTTVDAKQHFVHQEGGAVFKVAVRKMSELSENLLTRNNLTAADIDLFIPHQANKRIILSTAERLGMPEEKIVINIGEYGNTTAATIPLAMHTALEQGRLKKNSLILLASFGGGYTVGATLLRWEF